jgi:hypothetical protein
MYISFNESQLNLSAITKQEVLSFASIITKSFTEKEELQHFLKSLFYNHSILEHDQFNINFNLIYEYIGLDPPVDMGC